MAQLIRPLRQWPPRLTCLHLPPLNHLHLLLSSHSVVLPSETGGDRGRTASSTTIPSALRGIRSRPSGQVRPRAPVAYEFRESDAGSESDEDPSRKSRNQKKREARRAVQWGMDLASFSTPQIKRILGTASLEPEVFEAIMLVKRMGRDVREGKRRQFNYIGKLLREAEPELMDGLIQATKDGDQSRMRALCESIEAAVDEDDDGEEEEEDGDDNEEEYEEEDDEESLEYETTATRWFDGLVSRDNGITKEVYSIHSVDFDRQELRKLVRNVHFFREQQHSVDDDEGKGGAAELTRAEKSLTRFLRTLAKQMPTAEL